MRNSCIKWTLGNGTKENQLFWLISERRLRDIFVLEIETLSCFWQRWFWCQSAICVLYPVYGLQSAVCILYWPPTKPRGSKDPYVAKRAGNENAMGMIDTIVTQHDVSKWRMATLGMLDAIVTFQDCEDLELTNKLFSRFLALETCTGIPRTKRTANDSIRKHLLRRRNYSRACVFSEVANCNFRNIHFTWKAEWRPLWPVVS